MREIRYETKQKLFAKLIMVVGIISIVSVLSTSLTAQRRRGKSKRRGAAASSVKVIKTNIDVHYKSRVDVSNDIIVFGTGFNTGVSYIKPGGKVATPVPNGNKYSSKFFVAIGTKILLGTPNYTMAVFDTATGKMTEIPEDKVKLRNINGSNFLGGSIQKGGNYAAFITDTTGGDNSAIKVIDFSGAEPKVIRFEGSGQTEDAEMIYRHVAVDAKTGMVAGAGSNNYEIRVYDIKNPEKAPKVFDLKGYKGVAKYQMVFDNGKILFQSGETKEKAVILDVASGKFTDMSQAVYGMAMAGGKFVYFANRGSNDYHGISSRAVVGKVGSQPKLSAGKKRISTSANHGMVGFGSTAAITPDGKYIFIAGLDDVGQTERFQTYKGARFVAQRDATEKPAFLKASDLVASSKIVAFKIGRDNKTKLGYIKLK